MLKKTNIDVNALLKFIYSGGSGTVDTDLLEQIAALVTPTKKEPSKYEVEVRGCYGNDAQSIRENH
jgi:hypothetical protein